METVKNWSGCVKDQLDLENRPKAFLNIVSFSIKEDLLTKAVSSFECLSVPENISNGDVLLVYNPQGLKRYQGVITSIEGTTIQTNQIQHLFMGNWVYDLADNSAATLEESFKASLQAFAGGKMKGSTYVDPLVKQRLGGIQISTTSTTSGNFTSKDDNTVMDMEQMIYELYQNYQITVDIDMPFVGVPICKIGKTNLSSIKIGNNTNSIVDISPISEIEETNRLIIYSKEGTYRATYITKADGTTVKEPSTISNRFGVINTKIVFSDDEENDLVIANLPSEMFNHKLTFTLLLVSKLYKYDDFVLGMPLEVWNNQEYFQTILTAKELSKSGKANVTQVNYTCGTVRTKMTEKLLLKFGVIK